jgi:hypothetical protein
MNGCVERLEIDNFLGLVRIDMATDTIFIGVSKTPGTITHEKKDQN